MPRTISGRPLGRSLPPLVAVLAMTLAASSASAERATSPAMHRGEPGSASVQPVGLFGNRSRQGGRSSRQRVQPRTTRQAVPQQVVPQQPAARQPATPQAITAPAAATPQPHSPQRATPKPNNSKTTTAAPPADGPDRFGIREAQYKAFYQEICRAIDATIQRDSFEAEALTSFAPLLSSQTTAQRALQHMPPMPAGERNLLYRSLLQTMENDGSPIAKSLTAIGSLSGWTHLIHTGEFQGEPSLIVAFDRGGTHCYAQIVLGIDRRRQLRIVDLTTLDDQLSVSYGMAIGMALVAYESENLLSLNAAGLDALDQMDTLGRMLAKVENVDDFDRLRGMLHARNQVTEIVGAKRLSLLAESGDVAETQAELVRMREAFPESVVPDLYQMNTGLELGLFEEVAAAAARLAKRFPRDAGPLSAIARAQLLAGREADALETIDAAITSFETCGTTHLAWLETCLLLERYDLTLAALQRYEASTTVDIEAVAGLEGYGDFLKTREGLTWRRSLGEVEQEELATESEGLRL